MNRPRLGDLLTQSGVISVSDLNNVILEQKNRPIPLGELLIEKRLLSEEIIGKSLQRITGIPYQDCTSLSATEEAIKPFTRELAKKYSCVPVSIKGRELVLVMSQPQDLKNLTDLEFITGFRISPRQGFRNEIEATIGRLFGNDTAVEVALHKEMVALARQEPVMANLASSTDELSTLDIEFFTASSLVRAREAIEEFQEALRRNPTQAVRLFSQIICEAVNKKASDIHIDPQAGETIVRARLDGILRDIMTISPELSSRMVSRIKVLADLDIAERRVPQDGRFLVRVSDKKCDVRISTLPTHYGEKVVIRILDPGATLVGFGELGFSKEQTQVLDQKLSLPQGLILVCGPTGSGKTTTLYAALRKLSKRSVNIITVEDPIEYMLDGINQVQVNKKANLTFASSLRSILRQDPNIVMVGEIRDKETADIALQAAQTGHLVFSTLHTTDSIDAIDRLRDLGVQEFLVASSITAIIAQRLLRRLCSCAKEEDIEVLGAEFLLSGRHPNFPSRVKVPVGCEACDQTGYKGRVGACELLSFNNEFRRMINRGAGGDEIRAVAVGSGTTFMIDSALEKVKLGLTSIDEVLRVIPIKEQSGLACLSCSRELVAGFAFCPSCGANTNSKVSSISPKVVFPNRS